MEIQLALEASADYADCCVGVPVIATCNSLLHCTHLKGVNFVKYTAGSLVSMRLGNIMEKVVKYFW